ncbi:MAG: class I SAM-dependent methyltransferase [Kiloniellales bacterium]
MDEVTRFYDDLSAYYHLLFADWGAAVLRQGAAIDALIAARLAPGPKPVLDSACGIGTQAIGLALRGHAVTGSDLSPAAVARARREAERFGVAADFTVADLRRLSREIERRFTVALAFDNSLPHLLSDGDLAAALRELAAMLEPGGLFLASLRDYDALAAERPTATPVQVIDDAEGRRVLFQLWDWERDGSGYQVTQYILRHESDGIADLAFTSRYRALRRRELERALTEAGFSGVEWIEPSEEGYYQPVIAARKE